MKISKFALILVFSLFLTACGGGGSNSINMMPPADDNPPTSSAGGETQTAFSEARSTNSQAETFDTLAQVTDSLQQVYRASSNTVFGSVAQAYTAGLSPVSRVDTSFTGDRFTLDIERRDGNNIRLDSNRDDVYIVNEYTPSQNSVTNRPALDGYIVSASTSKATVAGVLVEWSNTDYTDYVAGGYWLHLDLASQGVEMGAFVDGLDYEGNVNLPATGTATYNGRAGGVYLSVYGSDALVPIGSTEMGEYNGDLSLVANFGTNTISGDIDNVGLFGAYLITPNGNVYDYDIEDVSSSGYVLAFGATSIEQNGQFTGNNVRLTHPDLNFSSNSGSWAGRFSTIDDNSGNPRAVVGTHQGYAETTGGTEAIFVGAHYGATNQFQ